MKKAIIIVATISALLVLMLAFASVVSADNGPHGNFGAKDSTSTTDSCAGCHRAHTGTAENLLRWGPTQYDFCTTCHGPVGAGAVTNVVDGKIQSPATGPNAIYPYANAGITSAQTDTTLGLNGGGFVNAMLYIPATGLYGANTSASSKHRVEGAPIGVGTTADGMATAWGGGANNAGPGLYGQLECSSCHDPHGSPNYRILNKGYGRGALTTWTLGAGKWGGAYDPNTVGLEPVVGSNEVATGAHNYASKLNVYYDRGITDFCGGCHQQYLITAINYADTNSYDALGTGQNVTRYRHPVSSKGYYATTGAPAGNAWVTSNGMFAANNEWVAAYSGTGVSARGLRRVTTGIGGSKTNISYVTAVGNSYNGTLVTCLTCHYAHGSAATAQGWAANVAPTNDSANLFLDNRGVCQTCHGKGNGGVGY